MMHMKKILMIMMFAIAPMAMSAVEYNNTYQPSSVSNHQRGMQVAAPAATFQSTSTLVGSGSAYSATPMLGEDGTASYNGASYAPAKGPRKATMEGDDDEIPINTPGQVGSQAPIGDAVLPLLLMASAFAVFVYLRRRKAKA